MKVLRTAMLLAVAAMAVAAAGCIPPAESSSGYGGYTPPTAVLKSDRKLYARGEDIKMIVTISAPPGAEHLDPWLPISGHFCVQRPRAWAGIKPPPSSARLAWAEFPPDSKEEKSRNFPLTINRVFPMNRVGWYEVHWEGRYLGGRVRTNTLDIRVVPRLPSGQK